MKYFVLNTCIQWKKSVGIFKEKLHAKQVDMREKILNKMIKIIRSASTSW